MSRLTEKNAGAVCCHCSSWGICKPDDTCFVKEVYTKLVHYEELEEQGKLKELPCGIGDRVWYIEERSSYTPSYHTWYDRFSFEIEYIEITEYWTAFGVEGSGMFADHRFYIKDIGETVFLTKEAAELKLAELRGK